jgi:hypothetical protein
MGHLGDPLNTFWQLFTVSGGSGRLALATPPGVASNGGLAMSLSTSGSLLSGFGPSQDLLVSPLAQTSNGGASWAVGVLPGGLARLPDALASPGGGLDVALLGSAGGTVVQSPGGLAPWSTLVTEHALVDDPATARCGVAGITAVSVAAFGPVGSGGSGGSGGEPIVGARCTGGGRAGIFERSDGGWVSVGPVLPDGRGRAVEVLRLLGTPAGAVALVGAGTGADQTLFALWSTDSLQRWTVSDGLALGRGTVIATGSTASGDLVVTVRTAGGTSASVIAPSSPQWRSLVAPPPGTSSVVATPGGTFDALAVDGSLLHVYALGSRGWRDLQTLKVPIQYGSSS